MFNKRKYFYKVNVDKKFDVNSVQYPGIVVDGLSSVDDTSSSASSSASASASAPASAAAAAAAAEPSSRGGSAFGAFEPWVMFANVFAILNALLWLLPFEFAEGGFTRAAFTVVGINLLSLYRRHGRPRFSKEYAQKIMTDERAHHCFHLAICSGSKPMLLMLVPHVIRSLVFITRYAPAYIGGVGERLGAERLAQLNEVCGQMRAQESQLLLQGAVFDIYLQGILVVYLVTGQCSFLTVMLYGQWLRAKYFVSNSCKQAFYQTRQSFDGVFRHERCPALVTRAYASVVGVLSGWGEIPRPPPAAPAAEAGAGGAAGGIGKYCVVM
jgi:hypothetical protein